MMGVLISASAEWRVVQQVFEGARREASPFGEWFTTRLPGQPDGEPLLFFQGGWGKIAAASSTQYVIDRWRPQLLLNLGTCGGFEGAIERHSTVLATRTVVYDIVEQMGDHAEAIAHYTTDLSLSAESGRLPDAGVCRTVLVSADRDILPGDIAYSRAQFSAVAADWESGAIAWVAQRNHVPCMILRRVTDLVGEAGGEAYGNVETYRRATQTVMRGLLDALPVWIRLAAG